jgi:hypothetical protein
LVFQDGYHLPDVGVFVWGGCVGVFVVFTLFGISVVSIGGVISVGFGCWVGVAMVTYF